MLNLYTVRVLYPVTCITLAIRAKDAEDALKKAHYQRKGTSPFADPLSWEVLFRGALLLKKADPSVKL